MAECSSGVDYGPWMRAPRRWRGSRDPKGTSTFAPMKQATKKAIDLSGGSQFDILREVMIEEGTRMVEDGAHVANGKRNHVKETSGALDSSPIIFKAQAEGGSEGTRGYSKGKMGVHNLHGHATNPHKMGLAQPKPHLCSAPVLRHVSLASDEAQITSEFILPPSSFASASTPADNAILPRGVFGDEFVQLGGDGFPLDPLPDLHVNETACLYKRTSNRMVEDVLESDENEMPSLEDA